MNNWSGTGVVGQDPKLEYVGANKQAKLSFSMAVYRSKDVTDWFQIEMWGTNFNGNVNNKRPLMYASRLMKGSRIGVTGPIWFNKYKDKIYTKCNANNIDLISNLRDTQHQPHIEVQSDDLPF